VVLLSTRSNSSPCCEVLTAVGRPLASILDFCNPHLSWTLLTVSPHITTNCQCIPSEGTFFAYKYRITAWISMGNHVCNLLTILKFHSTASVWACVLPQHCCHVNTQCSTVLPITKLVASKSRYECKCRASRLFVCTVRWCHLCSRKHILWVVTCHLFSASSGVCTIGQKWPQYYGLSPTPPTIKK
jgi:hypothetical protein